MPTPLKNYYRTLGIARSASAAEIRATYRQLAKQFHPDSNATLVDERFKEIAEAYQILGNPVKRARYDESFLLTYKVPLDKNKAFDAHWVIHQFQDLKNHVAAYSKEDLYGDLVTNYTLHLMENENMNLLKDDSNTIKQVNQLLLFITQKLDYQNTQTIWEKWQFYFDSKEASAIWQQQLKFKKTQHQQQKWMPLIIISIACMVSFIIYVMSKK